MPTNLPQRGGFQDLAPDDLISLNPILDNLAGANEHPDIRLQIRGPGGRTAIDISRVDSQEDGLFALAARVQHHPVSSQPGNDASEREIAARSEQVDGIRGGIGASQPVPSRS